MGSILTIASARVEPDERKRAVEVYRKAFVESGIGEVADAITLWESTAELGSYMVLVRYPSEEAADKGIEQASETDSLAELIQLADTPPDVRRYRIAGENRLKEHDVDLGSCLSLSVRQSDPGLGWDLNAELSRILEEIAVLPGFLGSIHGRSATVHEEVMSIALWRDVDSFLASVPSHHLFTLNVFQRIA